MDEATYMKDRVDDQINWLSGKSSKSQKSFKRMRLIVIILSVSIPFLVSYVGTDIFQTEQNIDIMKLVVGVAGVVIAAVEGIQALYKHQDKWINYRVTAESLKQEKMLFLTKAGMYGDSTVPFKAFVGRIETILGGENKQWSEYMVKNNQNPEKKDANKDIAGDLGGDGDIGAAA